MKLWYLYILQCNDGSYYTGVTVDLDARLYAHNHLNSGAKYTRTRRPVTLVYSETLASRSLAQKREAQIRRLTRSQKQTLITQYAMNCDNLTPAL